MFAGTVIMSVKETISTYDHPLVMAFGNPLLDIILTEDENDLLAKYNLRVDGQTELEEEEMEKLIQELPDE